MKRKLLIPNKFRPIGWLLLLSSIILWTYVSFILEDEISVLQTSVFAVAGNEILKSTRYFSIIDANITYTLIGVLFITGGLLVAFTKEKAEDEFISKLRLESFQWAVIVNYVLLLIMFLFVYGIDFINVVIYNMFTVLILFIIRFQYLLIKYNN